jgi:hypothetical protein
MRLKDYREFIQFIQVNEALGDVPSNGSFSPFTKVMLGWCGFVPSEGGDKEIYNLGLRGKDVKGEYNLFTSVSPEDNGTKCVLTVLVQGDYLKDLIRGSQKGQFRGPKSKMLGDILLKLRLYSGGDHREAYLAPARLADKEANLYGSQKKAKEKWYTFIYKISLEDLISILPVWSDFMKHIGFAPNSRLTGSKNSNGDYFDSGILEKFIKAFNGESRESRRLEVIFPGTWNEYTALQWAKELGLMAPVFGSIEEGTEYLKKFTSLPYKFNEVIVGSHGEDSRAYSSMLKSINEPNTAEDEFETISGFLEQLAKVTNVDSKVYFTSCYGGNYEEKLVRLAKMIGCAVYASEGVNYLGFKSEKKRFWMATPNGAYKEVGGDPPFMITFEKGSFLSGIPILSKVISEDQINSIMNYYKSTIEEWEKFQKNPWSYTAQSCSEFLDKSVSKFKDLVSAPLKLAKKIWDSW